MRNHYLYIKEDGTWNWSDNAFSGIVTLTPDRVSEYCREKAKEWRSSKLGNYTQFSIGKRLRTARRWMAAAELPDGEYEYYFNPEDKYKMFRQQVKGFAKQLGVKYELKILND